MKRQVWFCNLCEVEFDVSDVSRERVRCTGGQIPAQGGKLTADHWPLDAEFRRIEEMAEPVTEPETDGVLVLEEGKRFGLGDAKKAPDAAAERSRRLTTYGWPEGMA